MATTAFRPRFAAAIFAQADSLLDPVHVAIELEFVDGFSAEIALLLFLIAKLIISRCLPVSSGIRSMALGMKRMIQSASAARAFFRAGAQRCFLSPQPELRGR